jgi:hypothetical protein
MFQPGPIIQLFFSELVECWSRHPALMMVLKWFLRMGLFAFSRELSLKTDRHRE